MATTIITKNGTGAPLASDLVAGELAVDLTNKRLYTEDSGGTIIEVGSNPSVLDVDNININGNAIISTDTNGNIDLTPNGTGEVNISKVDIDAGAIDGTAIGANSASTGAFTTLTASTSLNIASSTTVDGVLDEDTMSSNSATKLATQQSIKAYVDSQVGANNELSEVLANGNTTGSTNIVVTAGQSITTDSILETTAAAGVDIDGVLLKDTSVGTDDASGTDVAGTTVTVKGGAGTGTGAGGSLVFQTAPAGTTGSSANAQVTALTIDSAGDATFTGASYNMSWDKSANSLAFADNAKAVFGAGSDLQIYHNGTHSFLSDQGTGNMLVLADNFEVNNSANNENKIVATTNGAVTLYYDNAAKIATTSTGIDVTGTVTADGLTVDGDIIVNDASPSISFFDTDGTNQRGQVRQVSDRIIVSARNNTAYGSIYFTGQDASTEINRMIIDGPTGDISFYEDTGTTAKLFWDASAESLGIGTTSPTAPLTIGYSGAEAQLQINNSGSNRMVYLGAFSANEGILRLFNSSNVETVRIPAESTAGVHTYFNAGNVGIGTSSPEKRLHIFDSTQANQTIRFGDPSATPLAEINYDSSGFEHLYISVKGTTTGYGNMVFSTGPTPSEAMRINSSGGLLIGTTSTATASTNEGTYINGSGLIYSGRSGDAPIVANRITSDGEIAIFRKDGTTVGSIGTNSGYLFIGSPVGTDAHLLIGNGLIHPATSTGATKDASIDIGGSSNRFKDLYLSGGVVFGATGGAVTSKTLDDYEEGTWTPSYSAATGVASYSVQTGLYTKIGNKVTVIAELQADRNTLSGTIKISGLPFSASGNGGGFYPTFAMRFNSDMPNLKGYAAGGEINLRKQATNATSSTVLTETDLSNAGTAYNYIYFTATYFTTA